MQKDKSINLASIIAEQSKVSNGQMKISKPENPTTNFDQEEKRLTEEFETLRLKANQELQEISRKKQEAILAKNRELKEMRQELLEQSELLKARSDEFPTGSAKQLELLTKAENLKRQAKSMVTADEANTAVVEVEVKNPNWFKRNRTVIMALFTSAILAAAFWYVMKWIKVEDPQAVPYDATTFQKFLVTACFFSALQALKSFAVLIYYPIIHIFKSNVQEPDFDFSLYFKNRLTPIQQVCISLFIPCWFALEFVLLFSAKF